MDFLVTVQPCADLLQRFLRNTFHPLPAVFTLTDIPGYMPVPLVAGTTAGRLSAGVLHSDQAASDYPVLIENLAQAGYGGAFFGRL